MNLITACKACNGGKSNVRLDESQVEPSVDADDLAERAEQVRAYLDALRELETAKNALTQHYVNMYCGACDVREMPSDIARQFVRLDEELGHELLAKGIAAVGEWARRSRYEHSDSKQTRYFFGVIRNLREWKAKQ